MEFIESPDLTQQGHHLWNAGKVVSNYLEEHAEELVQGKDVLELGAGAGLPSLTCAIKGAETVRDPAGIHLLS